MKTLLTLPLLLLSLISFPSWGETMDDLVQRDGRFYKKFTEVPFTGEVTGLDQGNFKNGKREGPRVVYYDNGQLSSRTEWRNGKPEGPWVGYYENGKLKWKGDFRNGEKEGSWVNYDDDGTLLKDLSGVFKDGVKISD